MAKNRKKNTQKKRNLKYGNVSTPFTPPKSKSDKNITVVADKDQVQMKDSGFRKEMRRNLLFVFGFFVILFIIYFFLTRTSLLNPFLNLLGLGELYKK